MTRVHVVNPHPDPTDVTLTLIASDGEPQAVADRNINGNGVLVELASDLSGAAPSGSDYNRGASSQYVIACAYLAKSGQYAQGLNGQDAAILGFYGTTDFSVLSAIKAQ